MIKRLVLIAMVLLGGWSAQAVAGSGNVNVLLGGKYLSSSDWAPYDEQGEFGVLFDIRGDYWPVSIAVDLLGSSLTKSSYWIDRTASSSELDVGLRKVFELPGIDLHPYVGGGLGIIGAAYEEYDAYYDYTIMQDSDAAIGYWLNGGIYWSIGGQFNVGVDARYSEADVNLFGHNVSAGGTHLGFVLGTHW